MGKPNHLWSRHASGAVTFAFALVAFASGGGNKNPERVSLADDGAEAIGTYTPYCPEDCSGVWSDSYGPALTPNGRFVAFTTVAPNLIKGFDYPVQQIVVRDRKSRKTRLVSANANNGGPGDGGSSYASISANGRFVLFASYARNLTPLDDPEGEDVFVHDRKTRVTRYLTGSPSEHGGHAFPNALSDNGRYAVFNNAYYDAVDDSEKSSVFLVDLRRSETTLVSAGLGGAAAHGLSVQPSISANGRFVAFTSDADDLFSGPTNGSLQVYVWDRMTRALRLASVGVGGVPSDSNALAPCVSDDGNLVAFDSDARNLVEGDTNDTWDVFLHDFRTGETTRISVGPGGEQGAAFSWYPRMTRDGALVVFATGNSLVPEATNGVGDVYGYDTLQRTLRLLSHTPQGMAGNGGSGGQQPASNGRWLAFASQASDLVDRDTNGVEDVFLIDPR